MRSRIGEIRAKFVEMSRSYTRVLSRVFHTDTPSPVLSLHPRRDGRAAALGAATALVLRGAIRRRLRLRLRRAAARASLHGTSSVSLRMRPWRSRTERWMTAAAAARPASRRTARKRRAAACTFTAALLRCSRIASWLKNSNMVTIVDSCRGGANGEMVRWRDGEMARTVRNLDGGILQSLRTLCRGVCEAPPKSAP